MVLTKGVYIRNTKTRDYYTANPEDDYWSDSKTDAEYYKSEEAALLDITTLEELGEDIAFRDVGSIELVTNYDVSGV